MNLADMLTFADISQLNSIANHYDCDCKRNSKHELIQSILTTLGRREFIEQQVQALSLDDLRFLNSVVFDNRSSFNLEELIALIRQTTVSTDTNASVQESPREVMLRFRKSGWLFNGATMHTRYSYMIPQDLKNRFLDEMKLWFRSRICHTAEPVVYREEQGLCADDLQFMLRYVQQHEIELNQELAMYRRHQQTLMSGFHIAEPLLGKGGWRFGYGRTFSIYPDRLSLIYEYALSKRYVEEKNGYLLLTSTGDEVLKQGIKESMVQIFRFWLKLYKGAIPNLSSVVYWIGQCSEEWVSMASLHQTIGWLIKPYYYDSPVSILEQRIVHMMMHLGLLRVGEGQEGIVIRLTAWGKSLLEKPVVV